MMTNTIVLEGCLSPERKAELERLRPVIQEAVRKAVSGKNDDTCRSGGCSAIGCEGGIYCFDKAGNKLPEVDPKKFYEALFTNRQQPLEETQKDKL